MSIDIQAVRMDTPTCETLVHFNNAGAALSPKIVSEAVHQHLENEQRIGGYEAATEAEPQLTRFYQAFAALLHCSPNEIAYAENATHAWNNLFNAIAFRKGDKIVTGQSEYASNYLSLLHLAKQKGVSIDVIPNDREGRLDLQRLEAALNPRVKLISLTHIPSQSGVIHPAAEVGKLARDHGILYLLDACQSAGQLELNVQDIGCDMLTGTGRKYLRGPRGTGFLYVKQSCIAQLEPTWIDLHSAQWLSRDVYALREDAKRFENWECFVAGKIGLGVAVEYALRIGLPAIEQRVQALAAQLRCSLQALPNVSVHEHGTPLSGIVSFVKKGIAADQLKAQLQRQGFNSSVIRLANNQLDLAHRQLSDLNRASLHYYNTPEEIERFCAAVAAL